MLVGDICNRDVVIASGQDSLKTIAQLMREHHVGDVVIVEKNGAVNKPIGIITDRDIVLEVLALDVPIDSCAAKDVMSIDLKTAQEQDGIWEVLQHMRLNGIRRLPVVDKENDLAGIVCADDFLELLADELTGIAKLVTKERQTEEEKRP